MEIFIDQFKNIIVLILLVASVGAFLIGDILEGIAVIVLVIVNAIIGFITEYKAEKSLEELREMVSLQAKVIRSGEIKEVEAEQVVPGDILVIEEGDQVSADARLIEADKLELNESVLTGESETITKDANFRAEEELPLAERKNMIYMGTTVSRGNGLALVTTTGTETEMGQIGSLLGETEEEDTPLEEKLDKLGRSLVKVTLVITLLVTIIGVFVGEPLKEMLKTGIALAIASVPEGLPIVATITLAIGMKKMVKNNALMRRLPAVETLGSTTIICTDKTGTLTENQMTLKKIYLSDDTIQVSGTGYKPEGEFQLSCGDKIEPRDKEALSLFLKAGVLCNNSVIKRDEDDSLWKVVGDPTEGALVTGARKAGYRQKQMEDDGYQLLAQIPFSSDRKYMAVSYELPDDQDFIFVKGAPETILEMSNQEYRDDQVEELKEERLQELKKINKEMAREGLRVLGLAYCQGTEAQSKDDIIDAMDSGLTFLGYAGIIDPPRQDAKEAIEEAQSAGIRIQMITGDQRDTAISIAEKVGINKGEKSISGQEIDGMSEEELRESISNSSVFARVSPENKLEIVESLQNMNEITAMTGDGVNDAPALKKADIGISMGQRGTSVARSASEMVLLDDSFNTIVKAIKQGRVIFDNIHKFIYYLFSSNLSKIIYIFLGVILQLPIPVLALQILWLNVVIDVFPALSLGWESPEPDVMSRSPRDPGKSILNNQFKKKLLLHSTIIALGPLITYISVLNLGYSVPLSRTISFSILAFTKLFHVFNARREKSSGFSEKLFNNGYLWGAVSLGIVFQLMAIYNPFL